DPLRLRDRGGRRPRGARVGRRRDPRRRAQRDRDAVDGQRRGRLDADRRLLPRARGRRVARGGAAARADLAAALAALRAPGLPGALHPRQQLALGMKLPRLTLALFQHPAFPAGAIAVAVVLVTLGLRATGALQRYELDAYDHFVRQVWHGPPLDPRV